MQTVQLGVYRISSNYFAEEISSQRIKQMNNKDKTILGYKIRDRLYGKNIKVCVICPIQNGKNYSFPANKSELEVIANGITFNLGKKRIDVKINKGVYIKNGDKLKYIPRRKSKNG